MTTTGRSEFSRSSAYCASWESLSWQSSLCKLNYYWIQHRLNAEHLCPQHDAYPAEFSRTTLCSTSAQLFLRFFGCWPLPCSVCMASRVPSTELKGKAPRDPRMLTPSTNHGVQRQRSVAELLLDLDSLKLVENLWHCISVDSRESVISDSSRMKGDMLNVWLDLITENNYHKCDNSESLDVIRKCLWGFYFAGSCWSICKWNRNSEGVDTTLIRNPKKILLLKKRQVSR